MAKAADELSTPLGQETARKKRGLRLPFTAMQAMAVLLGLFLTGFLTIALFTDNPFGGEPVAHVALRKTSGADDKPAPAASGHAEAAAKSASKQPAGGENKTVTIIDGSSGKRQDVVIGGADAAGDKTDAEPAPATAMVGIDQ